MEMSTLSSFDRACLVAKYNSNYKKESIDPKIFEDRTEAEIKYLRKTMGSTMHRSCGLEFSKEYKDYPDYSHFNFVMTASYVFNKTGALPFEGAVGSQPAQVMEIMDTVAALDSEREDDVRRTAEKENKKRGKH